MGWYKTYSSNAEKQKAYRLRKKMLRKDLSVTGENKTPQGSLKKIVTVEHIPPRGKISDLGRRREVLSCGHALLFNCSVYAAKRRHCSVCDSGQQDFFPRVE